MSKQWVITGTIDPSKIEGTVSGRFGAAVMFCGYSRYRREWFLIAQGREEAIAEPQMVYVEEEFARQNRILPLYPQPKSKGIRKPKCEQLELL